MEAQKLESAFLIYREPIIKYIIGIVKDWNVAEDITQEVFITLMRQNPKDSEISSYVYRIASCRAIDWLRSNKRRKGLFSNTHFDSLENPQHYDTPQRRRGTNSVEIVEDRYFDRLIRKNKVRVLKIEELKSVLEIINKLKPIERRTIKLVASGYSYNDIAEKTNTPIGTVRYRIYTVREKIKEVLKTAS